MSRSLQAPLRVVGNCDRTVVSGVTRDGSRGVRVTRVVLSRAARVGGVIGGLLSLSHVRTNCISLGERGISLTSFFSRLTDEFRGDFGRTTVRFACRLTSNVGACTFSRRGVGRMFCGLVSGTMQCSTRVNGHERGFVRVAVHVSSILSGIVFRIDSGKVNVRTRDLPFVFRQFCGGSGSQACSGRGKANVKLSVIGAVIRTRSKRVRIRDRPNMKAAFLIQLPFRTI